MAKHVMRRSDASWVVFTHKHFFFDPVRQAYVTDGGFPFQMKALAGWVGHLTVAFPQPRHRQPLSDGAPIPAENVSYVPLPWPGSSLHKGRIAWNHLRNLGRYWRLLRRADAVHCPVPSYVAVVPMLLALLMRKPLLVRYCGDFRRPKTRMQRFLVALMRKTAHWKCVSYLATGLDERPPHPAIPWIFATSLQAKDYTAADGPGDSPPVLAWVGRLDAGKGLGVLLAMVRQARRQGLPWRWLLVGDGPLRDQVAALIPDHPRLEWHRYLPHDELMARLRRASLFLFTSEGEGFPKVIPEAMAAGLPVLAFPISPLPALVREGARIFWLAGDTPRRLQQIQALLAAPDYRHYRAENRAVARRFSLAAWQQALGRAIERLYRRCPGLS